MLSTIVSLSNLTSTIELNATTSNYLYTPSTSLDFNSSSGVATAGDGPGGGQVGGGSAASNGSSAVLPVLPSYIKTTAMVFCIIIMCLGVIGNIMVPIVIFKTKDMRNSTNIFLVNLSVADLMVLLVCTPTVLVEVNSRPETWVLGWEMCKAVPFVELTVAHASVLTILAISFERYYAICKPLEAGYICTKARASLICLSAWFIAAVFTSPVLAFTQLVQAYDYDGSEVFGCFTMVEELLPCAYFISLNLVFFLLPLAILITIYALIAKTLMDHPNSVLTKSQATTQSVLKYRKQVIFMLGTVVLAFFLCLLPFRAFTLWVIARTVIQPPPTIVATNYELQYNILYFCRIMVYLNSAINPILYNIMSSKFRGGFLRLCGARTLWKRYKKSDMTRKSTTSSSTHTSSQQTSDSFLSSKRHHSAKYCSSLRSLPEVAEEDRKHVYVRAPLQIVNSLTGQKAPANDERFV